MKNIKALKLTTNNSYEAPPMMPLNLPVVTVEATDGKEVVMTTCKLLPPLGPVVMTAPRQGEVEGLNNWQATSGDINVVFVQKKSTNSPSYMSGGDIGGLRWSEPCHHVQKRDTAAALQHLHTPGPVALTANTQAEDGRTPALPPGRHPRAHRRPVLLLPGGIRATALPPRAVLRQVLQVR